MKNILVILLAIIFVGFVSCSGSNSKHNKAINNAERLMQTDTDSAMSILDAIEPSELTIDSVQAKYHYLKAW